MAANEKAVKASVQKRAEKLVRKWMGILGIRYELHEVIIHTHVKTLRKVLKRSGFSDTHALAALSFQHQHQQFSIHLRADRSVEWEEDIVHELVHVVLMGMQGVTFRMLAEFENRRFAHDSFVDELETAVNQISDALLELDEK